MSPPNTPNSDDSDFIEDLSFEYIADENGNVIRTSKGLNRQSTESPPTPVDSSRPSLQADGLLKPPPPSPLLAHARRASLSRSESAYAVLPPQQQQAVSHSLSTAPHRFFQRVASVPGAATLKQPQRQKSTDPIPGPTVIPPRSALAAYRARIAQQDQTQEEKENLTSHNPDAQDDYAPYTPGVKQQAQRYSPPLTLGTSRAGTVHVVPPVRRLARGGSQGQRQTSGNVRPLSGGYSGGGDTEPEDDPAEQDPASVAFPASQRNDATKQRAYPVNPITPGNRELNQSGGGSRPRRSASLSDALVNDPPLAYSHSLHQANTPYQHPSRPGTSLGFDQSQTPYLHSRAGTSLGFADSGVQGPRRMTMEERDRQFKQAAMVNTQLAEDISRRQHAEQTHQEQLHQEQQQLYPTPHTHQNLHPDSQNHRPRQSPSPTQSAAPSTARPLYNAHTRRDSDTLRSVHYPPGSTGSPTPARLSPSARGLIASSSGPFSANPNLAYANAGANANYDVNGASSSGNVKHRRSGTAPESGTTSGMLEGKPGIAGRTWAAGDVDEDGAEARERGRQQQQLYSQRSAPPAPVPAAAPAPKTEAAQLNRHMIVNKRPYARLDMIGKGGSSRVFRVLNNANEFYAIKRVSLDKTDTETMSGYMNEIALLKRLEGNSRIIRLLDSEVKPGPGGGKGYLFLVMELGEVDLARLLSEQTKEPFNMVWVAYYWQQMLQAVHVIHEEKIVHSDLKPANFVLVRGQLKLIDFGIANAIANDTTNIQRDHQIGTVNYMSPEAIELPDGMRRLKVGRASDVWSLGCILYQMVYGHPPFQHLSVYQKMKAIPDTTHVIDFPEFSVPTQSTKPTSPSNGSTPPPKKLDHLKRPVRSDVIACMKSCLSRNPKERVTIPELMEQDWLAMREPSPQEAVEPRLKDDETIITPYYMRQLLQYGIKLGQTQNSDMSPEALLKEGERLVRELRSIQQPPPP